MAPITNGWPMAIPIWAAMTIV